MTAGALARAAARYHRALSAGLPLSGGRSLSEGPTAGELLLESSFGRALQPALSEMYRRPITAGITKMVEQGRDEIARSVLAFYEDRDDVISPMRDALGRYARRGFNLGGQMGLEALELEGQFALDDEHIEGVLAEHTGRLMSTTRQARLSVAVTTAEEIGRAVEKQRENGLSAVEMLPVLSAWVLGRTVIRSANIAATESVRMTRWGMVWAFAGNGIGGVRHECAGDVERRCNGLCPPLCGVEFGLRGVFNPMGGIGSGDRIPLHPGCRCWYSPLTDGWVKPALIWTGFALGLLAD